jgi:hypothetical protein
VPIEIATGHFPMIEAPADLATVIDGLTQIAGAPARSSAS